MSRTCFEYRAPSRYPLKGLIGITTHTAPVVYPMCQAKEGHSRARAHKKTLQTCFRPMAWAISRSHGPKS